MTNPLYETQLSNILEELGKTLDITKNQYDAAVRSYKYVGKWLSSDDSPLAKYSPEILPQGSFLLQTMIRPILEDDELDIDIVCKLERIQLGLTQLRLKEMIGDRLKGNSILSPLLKIPDGRRCWTLQHAESAKFHLDVLPSVVSIGYKTILEKAFSATEIADTQPLEIRITDKTLKNYSTSIDVQEWLKSNPFGYAIWFRDRAKTLGQRTIFLSEAVQPVPTFQTDKLPLQRVVQILKRHRDIMFEGDEHKPISIIITTLAAKAYEGQTDIKDALFSVINRMELFIEEKYSEEYGKNIKWIANPVNDKEENFADKWAENKTKEENFYDWLSKVKEDFNQLGNKTLNETYVQLKSSLGTRSVNEAFRNSDLTDIIVNSPAYPTAFSSTLLTVPHRQQPIWQIRITNTVDIIGRYKHNGKWKSISPQTKVPKNCLVMFTATTNVTKPFEVYWQVVNTGQEATGDLRGGIFHSKTYGVGGLSQKETTRYRGTHWIECFIVKNGICVARSSEFFITVE